MSSPGPRARLEGWTVLRGAGADLAVLGPAVAIYAVLRAAGALPGRDADHAVVVVAVIGALVAPAVGGYVAGRGSRRAPLTHAAAAAALAVVAFLAFRLVDAAVRHRAVHPTSVVFLIIVSVSLGLCGGLAGFRVALAHRRPTGPDPTDPDPTGPDPTDPAPTGPTPSGPTGSDATGADPTGADATGAGRAAPDPTGPAAADCGP